MYKKSAIVILITFIFLSMQLYAGDIKIYIPREVEITSDSMVLSDITIIRGNPEDAAKASAVMLGKFSVPGQKITINRMTILSRLTANKISSESVTFSGAKEVAVSRKELTVSAKSIIAAASEFLEKNKTDKSIASYEVIRKCKDIFLPMQEGKVSFTPRLSSRASSTHVAINVDVLLNGKKIETSQVGFRPLYNQYRIFATADLSEGSVVSSENIKVETIKTKYPSNDGFELPVGLITKREIKAGQLIRNSLLRNPMPEILIKRNSSVVIKVDTDALTLTVKGQAMDRGSSGDMIKVKNIDSNKIINCKVNYDGTVSPVI